MKYFVFIFLSIIIFYPNIYAGNFGIGVKIDKYNPKECNDGSLNGIIFRYRMENQIGLQGEIMFSSEDGYLSIGTTTYKTREEITLLRITGKFFLKKDKKKEMQPFLALGVAIWDWRFDDISDSQSFSGKDSPFGFHLGCGMNYYIVSNLSMGFDVYYNIVKPELLGVELDGSGIEFGYNLTYYF